MTIELTYDEVVINAKKAYEEGRLGFQNNMTYCYYSYAIAGSSSEEQRIGCAIGVSFLDHPDRMEIIKRMPYNDCSIEDLIDYEALSFPSDEEQRQAEALQELHDNMCITPDKTAVLEKKFCELIGAKYETK